MAVLWKMQEVITPELIYDVRATSLVCMITWFLFRWKRIFVEGLVEKKVLDEVMYSFLPIKCLLIHPTLSIDTLYIL
jgi:hypothetical protein